MKKLSICILAALMAAATVRAQAPMTHYLFAYFTNNTTEGQQVCYATSENGLDFEPLNGGRPVLASDSISRSGGVRDPHLLRTDDGWFLQVLTDMDFSKGKWTGLGIVMLRSRDLNPLGAPCHTFPRSLRWDTLRHGQRRVGAANYLRP